MALSHMKALEMCILKYTQIFRSRSIKNWSIRADFLFLEKIFCVLFQNWEVMNTAVLTGRQVSQGMKVFIVSQAGTVADVTLQSSCHSEDESVLKVIAF